jgi:hypothetical protein
MARTGNCNTPARPSTTGTKLSADENFAHKVLKVNATPTFFIDAERIKPVASSRRDGQCFYRSGAPQAILQCRLVTAPAVNPSPGTSPMHAFDIVGGRR